MGATAVHAAGYRELYSSLAREFGVSDARSKAFLTWANHTSDQCKSRRDPSLQGGVDCIRTVVHGDNGVRFDSLAASSEMDLFPDRVVQTGKGSCLPVSFLVAILAESMGVTIVPVSLPGHVYLNFPSGINWEPNREGFRYSDEEYRKKYDVDPGRGRMAYKLSVSEFEGLFRYEIANRLQASKRNAQAIVQYRKAQTLSRDPTIPGNLALVLESSGERDVALKLLDSVWKAGARSEELVWNRAIMMLRAGRPPVDVQLLVEDAQGRRIDSERLQMLVRKIQEASP